MVNVVELPALLTSYVVGATVVMYHIKTARIRAHK